MSALSSQLEAMGVCVTLGQATILRDVSLAVRPGEVLGLIGPNGAGKSTLLRAMLGLVPCDKGSIEVCGRRLHDIPLKERARLISYAPQGAPVHWPLTVGRVIALGRVPHLSPWQDMQESDAACIERVMSETDTSHLKERIVTTLSGGERANVLMARAMAVEAPFLLADEPVASLDPYHQLSIMETIRSLAKNGVGIVVVLHDLSLAMRFSDRICVIDKGRLAAQGTPDEVMSNSQLEEIYRVKSIRGDSANGPYLIPWERIL